MGLPPILRCCALLLALASACAAEEAAASACGDSVSWYRKRDPAQTCGWVAKKTEKRCKGKVKATDGTKAKDACPLTCGECSPCADDAVWHQTKSAKRSCSWIAKKSSKRCKSAKVGTSSSGSDKVAVEACPATCGGECPVAELAAAPSALPTSVPTAMPTSEPSELPSPVPSYPPTTSVPSPPPSEAPSACPTVTPAPTGPKVVWVLADDLFTYENGYEVYFRFSTDYALYEAGQTTGWSYLVDVALVNAAGSIVDVVAEHQSLDAPFFNATYMPTANLGPGPHEFVVMEYTEGFVGRSGAVQVSTTAYPTFFPTRSPVSSSPSVPPTSCPTSAPSLHGTIHAQFTVVEAPRKGHVVAFSRGDRIMDGIVWGDVMTLQLTFTGDEPRDALVTVRLVHGAGNDGDVVSGQDTCGEIASIFALGENVASGDPFVKNVTVPHVEYRSDYRLSLIWMPYTGSRPLPPTTYTCTGDFIVVSAYPTRRPTKMPVPTPTKAPQTYEPSPRPFPVPTYEPTT